MLNSVVTLDVRKSYMKTKYRGSGTHCPIAQAAQAFGLDRVYVSEYTIDALDKDGFPVTGALSKKASKFVSDFDDKRIPIKKLKPFKCRVKLLQRDAW